MKRKNTGRQLIIGFIIGVLIAAIFFQIFLRNPSRDNDDEKEIKYVGSKNSDVYHELTCYYVDRIKIGNKVYFYSEAQARAAGYRPCKVCRP